METQVQDSVLLELRSLQVELRRRVLARRDGPESGDLARVEEEREDTIYRVDRLTEADLVELVERWLGRYRLTLVAEGIGTLDLGGDRPGPPLRLIVDPIDGTRPLLHDKRSAWILAGVAPDRGGETGLADIQVAVMTEIPTTRQWRADQYWAIRGRGAGGEGVDLVGGRSPLDLLPRPSTARDLQHGFAQVTRYFPGVKEELAAIEEELFATLIPADSRGRGHLFEDQYTSTGGQLHELFTGRDRFCADLRPLLRDQARARGLGELLCCHPYDICVELIARECGVCIEAPGGGPLAAPLDVDTDVAWAGYANPRIRDLVAPVLLRVLERRGLL